MATGIRILFAATLAALCLAQATPTASQLILQAPLSTAERLVAEVARENYYGASQEFTDSAAKVMTAEVLERLWTDLVKRYGELKDYEAKAADAEGTRYRIHVLCEFEKGWVDAIVTIETLGERGPVSLEFRPVAGPDGPFSTK